jgi:hypothetical protein
MKRHLQLLLALATFAAPALANQGAKTIGTGERVGLQEASDPSLGSMRAGRDQGPKAMPDSERNALKSAESNARQLGEMRGGMDTVEVLLIVVLVLLILILI